MNIEEPFVKIVRDCIGIYSTDPLFAEEDILFTLEFFYLKDGDLVIVGIRKLSIGDDNDIVSSRIRPLTGTETREEIMSILSSLSPPV